MSSPAYESSEFLAELRAAVGSLDGVFGPTSYLLIGAFARDVHVHLRAGLPLPRATADVDIGIAVPDRATFDKELERLERRGSLRTRRGLPTVTGIELPVDVLPFGTIGDSGIVTIDEVQYDVRGLADAFVHAEIQDLEHGCRVRVPSLSALIGLKLIAWAIRRKSTDAADVAALLEVTTEEPYSELIWRDAEDAGRYDYELALEGPYVHGRLLAAVFGNLARSRVLEVLDPGAGILGSLVVTTPPRSVREPGRSEQLEALRQGILDAVRVKKG